MKRIALCCASVLVMLCLTTPFASAAGDPMKVRYIAGPQGFSKPDVKLHIDGTKLFLDGKSGKKKHTYTVPLNTVTFISHSPVRFNRASQVSNTVPNADIPRMGSCSGMGCAGNILVLFAWGAYEAGRGAAVGVAATQHGKQHFITIDWKEDGVEYELQFEASKEGYSSLIKQLEDASGRKVFDYEARWKQAEAEIQREKSHAELVSLKKWVKMGELSLAPGTYTLVTIPRESNFAELYFFEGTRLDSTALRGVTLATLAVPQSPATLKQPEVDYTESAPTQIRQIRTATKTLTFVTVGPAPIPQKESPPPPATVQQ